MTGAIATVRAFLGGVLGELVARRLWPIAMLLLVAAVAIPMLLGKDAAIPPAAGVPATSTGLADGLASQPLVAVREDGQVDRRVLGARKDPFKPTGVQPSTDSASETVDSSTGAGSSSDSSDGSSEEGSSGGASSEGGATTPSTPSPTETADPGSSDHNSDQEGSEGKSDPGDSEDTFDLYSLRVAVTDGGGDSPADGDDEEEGPGRELKRLAPLLSTDAPAIIYLGLLDDGKTAVFLLDDGVTADGDGSCRPSPADCQQVHLLKGETEFFSRDAPVDGATEPPAVDFRLDVLAIRTKKTASASKARKARAAASTAGRRALRSRTSRLGRLRYDRRTGRLRTLSVSSYRTSMARASRRSAGLGRDSRPRPVASSGGPFARATGRRAGLGAP